MCPPISTTKTGSVRTAASTNLGKSARVSTSCRASADGAAGSPFAGYPACASASLKVATSPIVSTRNVLSGRNASALSVPGTDCAAVSIRPTQDAQVISGITNFSVSVRSGYPASYSACTTASGPTPRTDPVWLARLTRAASAQPTQPARCIPSIPNVSVPCDMNMKVSVTGRSTRNLRGFETKRHAGVNCLSRLRVTGRREVIGFGKTAT